MGSDDAFSTVTVIGLGLIGSSLVRALRQEALATRIVAVDADAATRDRVVALGLADAVTADPAEGVAEADLVVLCTPVGAFGGLAELFGPALKPGAIVSDVGSVKADVVTRVAPHLPAGVHLVPGHPVAGTEFSGPDAGFAALFDGRWCILTPPAGTDAAAVERVAALWRRIGMTVEVMEPDHHDRVLAITSHLPHLIAYTIVGTAADLEDDLSREVIKFSAGGFRDFTRIAASDPIMWRDIFLNNREAVLEILQRFSEDLTAMQRAIRKGEGETLEELFTKTREIRRGVVDARQA